jgi:O-antigen ligase
LWLVFVWIAIMESKPVFYWVMPDTTLSSDTYLDGNPVDRVLLLILIVLAVLVLLHRHLDWARVFTLNRRLCLFYLFLAVSVVWSDFPVVAFKRWFKDIGNIFMILLILTEPDPLAATRAVFVRCAYVLIPFSILLIKWYGDIGRYYDRWTGAVRYCGVTTNKNSLGLLAMISALVLIWRLLELKNATSGFARLRALALDGIVLVTGLWLLLIANSATALGDFLLGISVLFVYRTFWTPNKATLFAVGTYAFLVLSAVALIMPGLRGIAAESLGRDSTLTTRTAIWEAALNMDTNPLIGEGFGSVWLTPKGARVSLELRIPHAHNGYLETYLNSGLIGVVLLLSVLLVAGANARRLMERDPLAGATCVALFVSCIIHNYTEATFDNGNVVGFILMLLATRYYAFDDPLFFDQQRTSFSPIAAVPLP